MAVIRNGSAGPAVKRWQYFLVGRALSVQSADADAARKLGEANDALIDAYRGSLSADGQAAFDDRRAGVNAVAALLPEMVAAIVARATPGGTFDAATWQAIIDLYELVK